MSGVCLACLLYTSIIIGKRGAAIKRIGTEARKDLELLLGAKVFLDLSVKVRKNWRRDANQIRRFGYGEGCLLYTSTRSCSSSSTRS